MSISNQTLYTVSITGSSGSSPNDGFIDNIDVLHYSSLTTSPSTVATLANSLAKSRANIRWKFLTQQLQLTFTPFFRDIVAVGADANTPATAFNFVLVCDSGDSQLYTLDENNNNAPLTGIPALTRMCARALIEARTIEGAYFDPTAVSAPGQSNLIDRVGYRIDSIVVGSVYSNLTAAAAAVTITEIVT